MSQVVEDKDKKIADLRGLLIQAKAKIEQYKAQVVQKEKEIDELKKVHEKKVRSLEGDSQNIINQYEERLLRYQKSLEETHQILEKHQRVAHAATKSNDDFLKKLAAVHALTDSQDSVEELCEIDRCKQYLQSLQKLGHGDLQILIATVSVLVRSNLSNLNKRREQRVGFLKRETTLQKNIEQQRGKVRRALQQSDSVRRQMKEMQQRHQKNVEVIVKSKAKVQQQKTNEQFIKQLLIKLIMGPKEASWMAFQILAKVLKLSEDEIKSCQKKLK